jgi:peptidoglycan/xylan/chitin deacetylase (PgdA/CDA1 family)
MRYVVLRDDDTCAFTPPEFLERLYRPFLERGMPVNLAVIPEVRTDVRAADGRLEGFLSAGRGPQAPLAAMSQAPALVSFLKSEPCLHVAQHGCHHDMFEFGITDRGEIARRLERGAAALEEAGLGRPRAFVAPYDRISRRAFLEIAARFPLISTGWFEAGRVPLPWKTAYAIKKLTGRPHWRAGKTTLLSHPGCLLSHTRPRGGMLDSVGGAVGRSRLTVIVLHWWEFFRDGVPDEGLIAVLHQLAAWLASRPDVRVVSFSDVEGGTVPIS